MKAGIILEKYFLVFHQTPIASNLERPSKRGNLERDKDITLNNHLVSEIKTCQRGVD